MDQNSPDSRPRFFLLGGESSSELLRIGSVLRKETVGGALLVAAAIIALIWANSPLSAGYFQLRDIRIGYGPWHLELSLGEWASDGLLAIFFFLVGLELKREFLIGDLREPSKSVVPVAAAAGGVAVPAIIYSVVNLASPETLRGWAIPTATDIAFAVAVLALIGSHLPGALRIFLLTLAVVDDLIAIGIIAFFYSQDIRPELLLLVLLALGSYTLLAHRYRRFFATRTAAWLILLPLGAAVWVLVRNSGIHATVAGVMLGFAVPLAHSKGGPQPGGGLAEILEHRLRPVSAGIAVPVFAFFSAGVQVGGRDGIGSLFSNPVTVGIIIALVMGKPVGILGTVWLITKATRARLDRSIKWIDIFGVSLLGGIGFTVSLLVAELSFGHGSNYGDQATTGILAASLIASLLAAAVLLPRNRHYRRTNSSRPSSAAGPGSEESSHSAA
ncbi:MULTISPECIES: Na+/H+ antiporter NhaA [Micrococcaceae]|uniref:Na+/H+ antiporter NhaA n=1 Tax=Micrococcaceae TaxID=1268 RepID=UPI00115CDA70|nr:MULTISPECIES: Na+/H+ antiporter NhaA [Micrococcaceae]TQS91945.1 Na+/H+ antiporter NhaA [Arthrobacter sp. TS-15]BCW06993.1 Na(+)/H(+) antiporter NhaA [Arthrobacter sp. NtRootA1]